MGGMFLPLKRYADFNGRSRRKEFWLWMLFNAVIVGVLMGILFAMIFSAAARSTVSYTSYSTGSSYGYRANVDPFQFFRNLSGMALVPFLLMLLWGLVAFIPNLAVSIRRLHDTNRSGWFYLFNFIPFVGPFIFLVFCFMEGTRGPNQYGPDPKYGDPYDQSGHNPYGGGYPPPPYGGHPPQPHGGGYPPQPQGGYPPPPYGGPQGGPPYGGPPGGGY